MHKQTLASTGQIYNVEVLHNAGTNVKADLPIEIRNIGMYLSFIELNLFLRGKQEYITYWTQSKLFRRY